MKIKDYRADIDGLRAVAVLAVILYHAGVKSFSGGYVGVDVFFVISGFLITRLLLKDIEARKFSILSFYERRIRRIFPAYFGLAVGVLLLGYWLYLDDDFLALTESVFASTLSWANILFYSQAGYWDAASETKPMLHTWSLAVEEQFYVFYPIILFLTMRYARKYVLPVLTTIVLGSFAWSIIAVQQNPTAAFYLPHLRAWELIIGGLIAIRHIPLNKSWRNGTAAFGLLFILISVFLYTENTLFPGLSALLPVLGSAFIIHAGISGESFVGKVLGLAPFTFIGKISYSLYLWHWPILVFGGFYLIRRPTPLETTAMILLSFVMAVFSWWVIERPFRDRTFLSRRTVFAIAGLVGVIFISFNFINIHFEGFPNRFTNYYAAVDPNWDKWIITREGCRITTDKIQPDGKVKLCDLGADNNSEPEFMVWGDSHAWAVAEGINEIANRTETHGVLAFSSGCFPSVQYVHRKKTSVPHCNLANETAITYLQDHPDVKTVFLIARWNLFVDGIMQRGEKRPVTPIKMRNTPASATTNDEIFYLLLKDTISRIEGMGRQVVLVFDVPDIGYDVPDRSLITFRTQQDLNKIIAPSYKEYLDFNQSVFGIFSRLGKEFDNLKFVDPTSVLCPGKGNCLVTLNNTPLYTDDDHLSAFGAKFVAELFVEPLNTLKVSTVSEPKRNDSTVSWPKPNDSTHSIPRPSDSTVVDPNWDEWIITREDCRITTDKIQPDGKVKLCDLGADNNSEPEFMVWGDSHAWAVAEGINEIANRTETHGVLAFSSGCFPSVQYVHRKKTSVPHCNLANETAITYLQDHPDVKTVFLIARWNLYVDGIMKRGEKRPVTPIKMRNTPASATTNDEIFYLLLKDTISRIQGMGRQVVLVFDVPDIGYDVPERNIVAIRAQQDLNKIIAPSYKEYLDFNQSVFGIFSRLGNEFENLKFVDPTSVLCPRKGNCFVTLDNIPLYSDDDHLSASGSKFISNIFIDALKALKSQ